MTTQATILKNGPLKIEGGINLIGSDGKALPAASGPTVFLCRCGQSQNKPFCDGTHGKQGFQSEVKAV